MNLSPHFSLAEATFSETAAREGIPNDPPALLLPALQSTAAMMEVIRSFLGERAGHDVPVRVSSWYRCLELNRRIGSADTSDHIAGHAVDFRADAFGSPIKIAQVLARKADHLGIGQLIAEFTRSPSGGWVHVSTRAPTKAANRIITIDGRGTLVGIVP